MDAFGAALMFAEPTARGTADKAEFAVDLSEHDAVGGAVKGGGAFSIDRRIARK